MKFLDSVILHNICRLILIGCLLCAASHAWSQEVKKKKEIRVFIKQQVLVALEDGAEVYHFNVVTGSHGKQTTVGRYEIFQKHEKYTSHKYGSEMPYTMFFSKDGKAIHGTRMATLRSYLHAYLTESVGSKGCVGLTDNHAKILFEWAPVGTPVVIMREKK